MLCSCFESLSAKSSWSLRLKMERLPTFSSSPGEKYDQCERARNGEIDVIIGPRSALFVPFRNIGLIIMDEEHEGRRSEAFSAPGWRPG